MKIILILVLFKCLYSAVIKSSADRQQRLLILSLDGFRYDYIDRYNLKNFNSFLNEDKASKAPYMNPQYTTQTFPNHWSIATGSYVENHGIVANTFFDQNFNESFIKGKNNFLDLKWWNLTTPIWYNVVEKGLKTASSYWPGSEVTFYNTSLFTRLKFDKSAPFEKRIDEVIKWFNANYTFVSLYYHEPDSTGHTYGVDSVEFNQTIKEVDKLFGYLIQKLKENNLFDSNNFNLIVVSDHGMVNVNKHIIIDDYINKTDALVFSDNGNLIHFKPLIDQEEFVNKIKLVPNTTVYYKKEIPDNFHYKYNNRISDVILVAEEKVNLIIMQDKKLKNESDPPTDYEEKKKAFIADMDKANHGYDKFYPSMRSIFLVHGAKFKKNYVSPNHIENIDVYPLICSLLDLSCESRNGSFERISHFLKSEENESIKYLENIMDEIKLFIFNLFKYFKIN